MTSHEEALAIDATNNFLAGWHLVIYRRTDIVESRFYWHPHLVYQYLYQSETHAFTQKAYAVSLQAAWCPRDKSFSRPGARRNDVPHRLRKTDHTTLPLVREDAFRTTPGPRVTAWSARPRLASLPRTVPGHSPSPLVEAAGGADAPQSRARCSSREGRRGRRESLAPSQPLNLCYHIYLIYCCKSLVVACLRLRNFVSCAQPAKGCLRGLCAVLQWVCLNYLTASARCFVGEWDETWLSSSSCYYCISLIPSDFKQFDDRTVPV